MDVYMGMFVICAGGYLEVFVICVGGWKIRVICMDVYVEV